MILGLVLNTDYYLQEAMNILVSNYLETAGFSFHSFLTWLHFQPCLNYKLVSIRILKFTRDLRLPCALKYGARFLESL